jgi:hypothetical protein
MKASRLIPWLVVVCLVVSAGSYVSYLFTGSRVGATVGMGGLGLAVLLVGVWLAVKVGGGAKGSDGK